MICRLLPQAYAVDSHQHVEWVQSVNHRHAKNFRGFNFHGCMHCANTRIYKHACFAGLILVVHESTVKTVKIGPLKISRYIVLQVYG